MLWIRLLVFSKSRKKLQTKTVFINRSNQPKTSIEALSVVRDIQFETAADLTAESGTCEARTNGKKFGEIACLSLQEFENVPWTLPIAFAQTDLCRAAFHLSQGDIFLPRLGKVGKVKTKKLSEIVTLGPDGRDIYDGFTLTDTHTSYQAFWGYDAENIRQLVQVPNRYLNPLYS